MAKPRQRRLLGAALLTWLLPGAANAVVLDIAAALDRPAIAPVLAAFERANPDITLHYADLSTTAVEDRIHDPTHPPDIVISSAMPAQLAAVNAGYAQRLHSQAARAWPVDFKWRDAVFGFTFEPVVFAYRRDRIPAAAVPRSHGALYRTLNSANSGIKRRQLALYDPARSAVGYALYQADAGYTARFWQLVAAFGRVDAQPIADTHAMLEALSSGRVMFAYNLIGSYALRWAATHSDIAVVVPRDYALVLSRMLFIHRDAPHPGAARRFADFMLSTAGQTVLARKTRLYSPRSDIEGPHTSARLKAEAGRRLMPITLDAGLLALADPARRAAFLERWRSEMARSRPSMPPTETDRAAP